MPTEIFRKVSLDRLSSPEQIDQLLQVTTSRSWVALLALCGMLATALVWSVTSQLYTTLNAPGVITRVQGVDNIVALGTGTVLDIKVKPGDNVKAGQVVAHVAQPALEQKLQQARAELADAQQANTATIAARAQGDVAKLFALKQQVASHENDIAVTQEQIKYANEQIPVDNELVQKGLITKQTLLQDKQKVQSLESKVEQLRVEISQAKAQQVSLENDSSQVKVENGNRINGLIRNVRLAQQAFESASEILSPGAGRVVEIVTYNGAFVSAGQPILSYEPVGGQLELLAYAPADKAKEIKVGMNAHISPSGIQREEYGYMLGKVSWVGYFPATTSAIAHTFENESLAQAMTAGGPVTEVHIALTPDSTTQSGYAWSSRKGPPTSITTGSVSSTEIVTRAQHPIELVLPYLKRKAGLT